MFIDMFERSTSCSSVPLPVKMGYLSRNKPRSFQWLWQWVLEKILMGKEREETGLGESIKEYTQHRCLEWGKRGGPRRSNWTLNTLSDYRLLRSICPCVGNVDKRSLCPRARPLQWCFHSRFEAHFASPTLPQSISDDNPVLRVCVSLCSSGFSWTKKRAQRLLSI